MRICIVNLGLYRSGTTTLAKATEELFGKESTFRAFPGDGVGVGVGVGGTSPDSDGDKKMEEKVDANALKGMLISPKQQVEHWWNKEHGQEKFFEWISKYHLICDGYIPLLVFFGPEKLQEISKDAQSRGIHIQFVVTTRDVEGTVTSELHHWVRHNLEARCELTMEERENLPDLLRTRKQDHDIAIEDFLNLSTKAATSPSLTCLKLPLSNRNEWAFILSNTLEDVGKTKQDWDEAFKIVGVANKNPRLPIEGILLTLRVGKGDKAKKTRNDVLQLLHSLEDDELCQYLIVLAIDADEYNTDEAHLLIESMEKNSRASLYVLKNDEELVDGTFAICKVWNKMTIKAWEEGADWVVLLGDDTEIKTKFHYRCTYRAFLDLSEKGYPEFFGCPWWNDESFPAFPTFPVVGKKHYEIFKTFIPKARESVFVNQDLDPYVQRLYLKFGASPPMRDRILKNTQGGSDHLDARYNRVSAKGWKDFVLEDVQAIERYLGRSKDEMTQNAFQCNKKFVIDIAVPTYRLNREYLERICQLDVPDAWRTTFIIIVDNPKLLLKQEEKCVSSLEEAERSLERQLVESSHGKNNVRVRVNAENSGASASRNRAIQESTADYILFFDDDIIPRDNVLQEYHKSLLSHVSEKGEENVLGLMGMVEFPRSPDLPMIHAAVLMSFLTFVFEIAKNPMYSTPAWGVTASIMVKRRSTILFDTDYAKTGGGEDVDFCLRLGSAFPENAVFFSAKDAIVEHPFWKGGIPTLAHHFFNWAVGDSALFSRFPEHCFWSYPNASEMIMISFVTVVVQQIVMVLFPSDADDSDAPTSFTIIITRLVKSLLGYICADLVVDLCDYKTLKYRIQLLGPAGEKRSWIFLLVAHGLANLFVIILEFGRLWGHCKRGRFYHIAKRFDWHIGRLKYHRQNFSSTEGKKFAIFLVVFVWLALYDKE